ncbi:MAG: carboxylating nicotinate-nucleotide diphosphorylase [Bacilli bacterium]|nr:carboxylating nicotinate-nucleotide diphosphorylase [Bacilli bacterium]
MNKTEWIIKNALKEDMPKGDVSTDSLFGDETTTANFIAKEAGIISGMSICRQVFQMIDPTVGFMIHRGDSESVEVNTVIATVKGRTASILKGERLALNILQRMSGVATLTNKFVTAIAGSKAKIYDTRKTTPNLRVLEKRAVLDGGGRNHRMNLSDMVMLKDNHIKAVGSISEAVAKVRAKHGKKYKIEVEVETLEMFVEALETDCDIIMLDNMNLENMKKCVETNAGRKRLEASGNMTLERVRDVALTGVDMISVGMITHSYKSLDISLKF